jgi:putative oxidoreductase
MHALARLETAFYVAFRFVVGFLFLFHGSQKLLGFPNATALTFDLSQKFIGGIIELSCGALIALGLFTRPAAILASGTMAVAFFQFHLDGNFADWHWLPIVNKGEMAALYSFAFLFIAAKGPGRWSLDRGH